MSNITPVRRCRGLLEGVRCNQVARHRGQHTFNVSDFLAVDRRRPERDRQKGGVVQMADVIVRKKVVPTVDVVQGEGTSGSGSDRYIRSKMLRDVQAAGRRVALPGGNFGYAAEVAPIVGNGPGLLIWAPNVTFNSVGA